MSTTMKIPTAAKAIIAAIVAGLAPVGTAAATGPVTSGSVVASIVTALVGFGATYFVPNGKGAGALLVTLKTDADRFLAVILDGLPTLVESATLAALNPAPGEPAAPPMTADEPVPAVPSAAPVADVEVAPAPAVEPAVEPVPDAAPAPDVTPMPDVVAPAPAAESVPFGVPTP